MIYGTIVRHSRKSAHMELYESPEKVICLDCLEPANLKIVDCGFGDDFGGVVDYRVATDCCESTEWLEGCSCCGEVKSVQKHTDGFWYCEICRKEEGI